MKAQGAENLQAMMDGLLKEIRELRRSGVCERVDARIRDFQKRKSGDQIFSELCFCIMTANFTAERSMMIQDEIGAGFCTIPELKLAKKLRELGHRFPNTRANYIACSRGDRKPLEDALERLKGNELRNWIVANIKGLGMKEASHFLRNIGFSDYAIIDFHIVDVLVAHKIIKRPKTLSKKRYLEIEDVLRTIAKKLNMTLAELDLYLWYMETGKILK